MSRSQSSGGSGFDDRQKSSGNSWGSGGFSKHTHNLVVTKHIPKFLQTFGQRIDWSGFILKGC